MTMIVGAILLLLLGIVFGYIAGGGASAAEPEPAPKPKPARRDTAKTTRKPAARKSSGSRAAKDDLKKISGVGPAIEKKLNAMGVKNYKQIAAWKKADIDKADEKLNFKGRIQRENWVAQAKTLAGGGETEFSRRQKK